MLKILKKSQQKEETEELYYLLTIEAENNESDFSDNNTIDFLEKELRKHKENPLKNKLPPEFIKLLHKNCNPNHELTEKLSKLYKNH